MSRRVLLLAYMFPPIVDGGAFRPAAFARYLPRLGWDVNVLTRPDHVGLPLDESQLAKFPPNVRIERVTSGFADGWNEHFRRKLTWIRPFEAAIGRPAGSVADALAWRVGRRDHVRQWEVSWMRPAIAAGMEIIKRERPDVILASGPPFESLKAGAELHRRTGIPLVADFRDPWTYGVLWHPSTERRARLERAFEATVVGTAAKVIVVTPSMHRTMLESYPAAKAKVELVMNGYEDLVTVAASPPATPFTLRHVGSIMERRLSPVLFEALRRLRRRHPGIVEEFRLQLIGPNLTGFSIEERLAAEEVSDMVEYLGAVGPDRSRELMRAAHVLVHIESTAACAVSSKLFDTLAAGRPILGLTLAGSDDEWFLLQSGAGSNAGVDDPDQIASSIETLWKRWKAGNLSISVDSGWLRQFHRFEQTRKLASILDSAAQTTHT